MLLTLALGACLADKDTADSKQTLASATASPSAAQPSTPTQSSATAQTHQQSNQYGQSLYSLEQIQAQLQQLYAPALAAGEPFKRLVENPIRYGFVISHSISDRKPFFVDTVAAIMTKISQLTGKDIARVAKGVLLEKELVFVFTHDFYESFKNPLIREVFLRTKDPYLGEQRRQDLKLKMQSRNPFLLVWCSTRDSRYLEKNTDNIISRQFCLYETKQFFMQNFAIYMRSHILAYLINYDNLSRTNLIPSITNETHQTDNETAQQIFVKDNRHWHPFDAYLLQAIYSDAVQVGMPLAQAITILAQHIHHHFSNQHSNHSSPSTP